MMYMYDLRCAPYQWPILLIFREDAGHPNLAVCLTYMCVDIKKFSKLGAESVLYAGATLALQYTQSVGYWRARGGLQQYKYCIFEL